jgi:16S rRNA (adenine1518-N6/adenine1519-N6)-dimethyltransferase
MDFNRPKKSLGQNFLVDRQVQERIIESVGLTGSEQVLEVGPGRGALTRLLAERAGKVLAIELDRQLSEYLQNLFSDRPLITVLRHDILRVDLAALLKEHGDGRWRVAANLPYNISSQVLFLFLEHRQYFERLVLMLQKEVGERLLARPGSKEYGILTVLLQLHFDIRREFLVRPGSFHPVPKVDSLVLSFEPLVSPRFDVGDEDVFRRIVKAAFGQRRKTLHNCLKTAAICDPEVLDKIAFASGIDLKRRGETLSLEEFAALSRAFKGKVVL